MRNYLSLSQIQADLKSQQINLVDLVGYYIDRVNTHKHLNAFIEIYPEEALAQAALISEKMLNGKAGKLAGLVIGIKDLISYKNHKVSASSKILEGFTAIINATVTERLLAEDAIILGRLNCDEFAMGASNETSYYGPVLNHADNTKVPGGSSGGSAVAVQADLCHASLGTDTGGSIRQPAAFCGLVGIKPTYGRVSRNGVIAYASSFDQVGPITKCVEDSALILEVIAGKDNFDSTASSLPVPNYSENLSTHKKLKFGYIKEVIDSPALDSEIRNKTLETFEKLKAQGHSVEEVHFPYLDYVVPTYYILTTAEASSNLSRYDGVHFGYRSPKASDLESVYKKSRTEGFGAEVKRRIMLGTFVLSAGYYDAYYSKAQKVRRLIQEKSEEILSTCDFMIMPTTPSTAFGLGEKTIDPVEMYLADIFTVQAPLAGLPAISLPAGIHSNGLPFGIQLIGSKFTESELFAASKYLESSILQ